MAKMKREINFIAAQKMMGKAGQTTSFEFVLVVTVVIVAMAMVGWYLFQAQQYNAKLEELKTAKIDLANKESEKNANEKKFAEYEVAKDEFGNDIYTLVNGKKKYQYDSITTVSTKIAEQLADAESASTELKGKIDLTSSVLQTMIYGSKYYNCTISNFTYFSTKVTAVLTATSLNDKIGYYKFMAGSIASPLTFDPTQYVTGTQMSGETQTTDSDTGVTIYKFTLTFTVYSDSLYIADDAE